MKVNIAGVMVDNISKVEVIEKINSFVQSGQPHYVVTPYSELIVFALNDLKYRQVLNHADLSLPDGFGLLWASKYLSLPKSNWFMEYVRLKLSLLRALFDKPYFKTIIPEVITGSRLIYDIGKLASDKNYSISLVGGAGNVAAQSAYELKKLYPNLNIKLALSGRPFDDQIIKEINHSNSDILLIGYSPPKQETWMAENLQKLNVKVVMGIGGSFDYLAHKHPMAPNIMHSMGLEWLWRLITQPWRVKRIWNAVPVFVWKVYKYKLKH